MIVDIPDHSREELTKLRCFLTGYRQGRGDKHTSIPGEEVLRLLIMAIDSKEVRPKRKKKST